MEHKCFLFVLQILQIFVPKIWYHNLEQQQHKRNLSPGYTRIRGKHGPIYRSCTAQASLHLLVWTIILFLIYFISI